MRLPRLLSIIGLLLVITLSFGQTPPPPTSTPFTGSEITKLKLLSAYKSALLAQQNAQAALQKVIGDWNAAQEAAAQAEKLPKGTTFQIDPNSDTVKVVPPPAPASAKKEEKAPPAEKK
jgi:hypothetical protein